LIKSHYFDKMLILCHTLHYELTTLSPLMKL
jgi:hypothetical protein